MNYLLKNKLLYFVNKKHILWYFKKGFLLLLILGNYSLFAQKISITNFGAINNGNTLNTKFIQNAIDACAKAGGGEVIVPTGGTYLTGTIFLKSNVFLKLEAGAKLQGSPNMKDYSTQYPHLIYAEKAMNTGIIGHGVIDGNGASFWDENFLALERPEPWLVFSHCQNLKFEQVQLLNSPAHVLVLDNCDGAVVNALRIVNPMRSPNTDGVDITDSRNVFITNCYFETGDDAICLKSDKAWVENVVATNNIIISDDAAIKLGTAGHVGTRYCLFSNNIIRNSRYGIALFQMDGGTYEHCQFLNMTIQTGSRHATEYPIFVDIDRRRDTSNLGIIRHIEFSNLQIETRGKCLIAGQPQAPIENLVFNNITLIAAQVPATDLSEAKKPRGNKTLGYYADLQDFAKKNAWFTFGNIKDLQMQRIVVRDARLQRTNFSLENVSASEE
ncbi:MAG: hypothetical protein HC892_11610 [Saprospiraceae bacterium]|nr:hypothetical protein [Saprospiraceae bacterium]